MGATIFEVNMGRHIFKGIFGGLGKDWPLLFPYLALAWEHQFLAFFLHERTLLARNHDQIGNLVDWWWRRG
jgi:hypothetical protein